MRGLRDVRRVFVHISPNLSRMPCPSPAPHSRSLAKFVHDYDENVIVRLQFDCASLGQRVCDGLMSVQVRTRIIHTKTRDNFTVCFFFTF